VQLIFGFLPIGFQVVFQLPNRNISSVYLFETVFNVSQNEELAIAKFTNFASQSSVSLSIFGSFGEKSGLF